MRPAFFALVWSAVSVGVFSLSACYGHTCESSSVKFGRNEGEGHLVTENEWETTAFDARWLDFPHQRFIDMDLHELGADRIPIDVISYVSAQADQAHEAGNFTLSAGNLTTLFVEKGHVIVHNDTCADYYVRVTVRAAPIPPAASSAATR